MRICFLFHNLFDKNDIKLEQKIVNDGNFVANVDENKNE
jgi:hypothetical protein